MATACRATRSWAAAAVAAAPLPAAGVAVARAAAAGEEARAAAGAGARKATRRGMRSSPRSARCRGWVDCRDGDPVQEPALPGAAVRCGASLGLPDSAQYRQQVGKRRVVAGDA